VTPALPDLLMGQLISLTAPQPPEAGGDYMAGRIGLLATLAALGAQEAERGVAARMWENGAMRALFARAAGAYDDALQGDLALAAEAEDEALSWSVLDRVNAELRRLLIRLHEAVEARGDEALDREILRLYQGMARARRLDPPPGLSG
jgi:L-aminopeptidase/D-esterase-like protein